MANEADRRAYDLIRSYRDYYGSYHHHKEVMAYSVTVLYLGGTAALVFQDPPIWTWFSPSALLFILLGVSSATAFAFVVWQLRNREFAADMVAACTDLAARWLINQPTPADLQERTFRGRQWPDALVRQMNSIVNTRRWWEGPRISEILAYVIMGSWTLLVLARVLYTCVKSQ